MAILAAFESSSIHRLSLTWELLNENYISILNALRDLLSNSKNFGAYRTTLLKTSPPCIPFIGLYLTDLIFIKDSTNTFLKQSTHLLNFSKLSKTAEVLKATQQFLLPFNLKMIPEIQLFIDGELKNPFNEEELYTLSCELEAKRYCLD
jgi:son of sevenless-like protein